MEPEGLQHLALMRGDGREALQRGGDEKGLGYNYMEILQALQSSDINGIAREVNSCQIPTDLLGKTLHATTATPLHLTLNPPSFDTARMAEHDKRSEKSSPPYESRLDKLPNEILAMIIVRIKHLEDLDNFKFCYPRAKATANSSPLMFLLT
ncbi:MAG: hypothetical protein Q9218_004703 [Villophora microphyllina]